MQIDFTIWKYKKLLKTLIKKGFLFQTFLDFINISKNKNIILRHDVDRIPVNSLQFARIEVEMGLKGTYFFRTVPKSFDLYIIEQIPEMGHEVGYHYEDLSFAWAKFKAEGRRQKAEGEDLEKILVDIAIESFAKNLEKLRKISPVRTICMHGSPMSKWDSRLLWKYYDYRDFGIIGEPYFDVDFDEVLYLTDTGRRWDGDDVSVRDKAVGGRLKAEGEDPYKDWKVKPIMYRRRDEETEGRRDEVLSLSHSVTQSLSQSVPKFHSTSDIIKAANEGLLPDQIMMTFHPQRWTNKSVPWVKELVWQNVKNAVKYFLVKMRDD